MRGTVADDRRREPLQLSDAGSSLVGELSEDGRVLLGEVAAGLGDDLDRVTMALELLGDAMARETVAAALPAVAESAARR